MAQMARVEAHASEYGQADTPVAVALQVDERSYYESLNLSELFVRYRQSGGCKPETEGARSRYALVPRAAQTQPPFTHNLCAWSTGQLQS